MALPGRRRPGPVHHRQGVHGVSNRSTVFRIALKFQPFDVVQLSEELLYSTSNTAFPEAVQSRSPGAG
jgi:hypothetical protein